MYLSALAYLGRSHAEPAEFPAERGAPPTAPDRRSRRTPREAVGVTPAFPVMQQVVLPSGTPASRNRRIFAEEFGQRTYAPTGAPWAGNLASRARPVGGGAVSLAPGALASRGRSVRN